jgi:hypothetical protein
MISNNVLTSHVQLELSPLEHRSGRIETLLYIAARIIQLRKFHLFIFNSASHDMTV